MIERLENYVNMQPKILCGYPRYQQIYLESPQNNGVPSIFAMLSQLWGKLLCNISDGQLFVCK